MPRRRHTCPPSPPRRPPPLAAAGVWPRSGVGGRRALRPPSFVRLALVSPPAAALPCQPPASAAAAPWRGGEGGQGRRRLGHGWARAAGGDWGRGRGLGGFRVARSRLSFFLLFVTFVVVCFVVLSWFCYVCGVLFFFAWRFPLLLLPLWFQSLSSGFARR